MKVLAHWRYQRISAILLLPLTIWTTILLINLPAFDSANIKLLLSDILSATVIWLTISLSIYHGKLGVDVIVEDYINEQKQRAYILLFNIIFAISWTVVTFAVFSLIF